MAKRTKAGRIRKPNPYKQKMNVQKAELYKQVQRNIKEANNRIRAIEKTYGKESWASKKYSERLSSEKLGRLTKKGRASVSKNMTITDLKALDKATEQFLNSKTSTLKGIKSTIREQKKAMKKSLSDVEKDVSDADVETYYNFFGEDYSKDLLKYATGSEVIALFNEAKEMNLNLNEFEERIKSYIFDYGNDVEMKTKITKFYNDYIK